MYPCDMLSRSLRNFQMRPQKPAVPGKETQSVAPALTYKVCSQRHGVAHVSRRRPSKEQRVRGGDGGAAMRASTDEWIF